MVAVRRAWLAASNAAPRRVALVMQDLEPTSMTDGVLRVRRIGALGSAARGLIADLAGLLQSAGVTAVQLEDDASASTAAPSPGTAAPSSPGVVVTPAVARAADASPPGTSQVPPSAGPPPEGSASQPRLPRTPVQDHPLVRQAMELFGARVVNVQPRVEAPAKDGASSGAKRGEA